MYTQERNILIYSRNIAGLISGICWLIGDVFLVGFDIEEEKYKDFLQITKIKIREWLL